MEKRGILYLILALSVGTLLAIYLMLGFYYNGTFSYGTWINHVYCTGKSAEEANVDLKNNSYYSGLIITAADDKKFFIDACAIDFKVDYYEELSGILEKQNPFAWGLNLITSRDKEIIGNPTFDEEKLKQLLSNWEIFGEDSTDYYELKRGDNGYYIQENNAKQANFPKFYDKVRVAIYFKEHSLDLSDNPTLYDDKIATDKDKESYALYQKITDVQDTQASLRIGDKRLSAASSDFADWIVTIDELSSVQDETFSEENENPGEGMFIAGDKVTKFPDDYKVEENFVTDSNGNVLLSCAKIYNFVSGNLKQLETNSCIDRYQKNGSGTIYVSGNKTGELVDEKSEYENFLLSVEGKGPAETEITLPVKSFTIEGSELGEEYILVDMGNQHLRYYKDGKLTIQYDIVTGNTSLGRGTPVGLYHVYNKRYHTILRGADYASYVNYWLGVNKGIGIHDATWRSDFGGEIYKHSGSHGCINSPLELMEELYDMVDVGVPVLLYY